MYSIVHVQRSYLGDRCQTIRGRCIRLCAYRAHTQGIVVKQSVGDVFDCAPTEVILRGSLSSSPWEMYSIVRLQRSYLGDRCQTIRGRCIRLCAYRAHTQGIVVKQSVGDVFDCAPTEVILRGSLSSSPWEMYSIVRLQSSYLGDRCQTLRARCIRLCAYRGHTQGIVVKQSVGDVIDCAPTEVISRGSLSNNPWEMYSIVRLQRSYLGDRCQAVRGRCIRLCTYRGHIYRIVVKQSMGDVFDCAPTEVILRGSLSSSPWEMYSIVRLQRSYLEDRCPAVRGRCIHLCAYRGHT